MSMKLRKRLLYISGITCKRASEELVILIYLFIWPLIADVYFRHCISKYTLCSQTALQVLCAKTFPIMPARYFGFHRKMPRLTVGSLFTLMCYVGLCQQWFLMFIPCKRVTKTTTQTSVATQSKVDRFELYFHSPENRHYKYSTTSQTRHYSAF